MDEAPSTAVPMPRLLDVMWGREQTPRRGPKPALTLAQIAAAGVAIADAEGLSAVSMSRVAKDLGFTTMSLYRYVTSKDELETAMLDQAYGAPYTPWEPAEPNWRVKLQFWASAIRGALVKHPWILQIPLTEPPLAPNQIGWMELGIGALEGIPLAGAVKLSSLLLVDVYTRGQTQLALNLTGPGSGDGATLYGYRLWELTDDERFPHLRGVMAEGSLTDDGDFDQEEFSFGLTTVLDGIQARIDRA